MELVSVVSLCYSKNLELFIAVSKHMHRLHQFKPESINSVVIDTFNKKKKKKKA